LQFQVLPHPLQFVTNLFNQFVIVASATLSPIFEVLIQILPYC
jgi:hypothetical protein